jgi:hypothetical protein
VIDPERMSHLQLLLIDLDDVLLFSNGYRAALRGAVGYYGRRLGYPDVALSDEDIDVFEAFGLTAEWDSATVCVCLMLAQLWHKHPDHALTLDEEWPTPPQHNLPVPAFREFVASLRPPGSGRFGPLGAAEEGVMQSSPLLSVEQEAFLRALLRGTRQFDRSPIHRLIQEFNLGSRRYAEIYGAQPTLAVESTLLMLDHPRLDDAARRLLTEWADDPDHRAVIFTNRPSTPPDGAFDTPEAELGLEACGLMLRVAGGGGLGWIAQRRGLGSGDLLKPSPVHALAALRLALGQSLREALEASADLALDGKIDSGWGRLDGCELCVFEDSAKGLRSAAAAVGILKTHGVSIECALYGVSDSEPKRAALAAAGATLFSDIQSALGGVKGLEGIKK